MKKRSAENMKKALQKADPIWIQNPVLAKGLTIASIIVACVSLQRGLALGITFSILTFFTVFATSFLSSNIPYTFRVIINALLSALLFIPSTLLVETLFPGMTYQLGIYLPLLVVNSIIIQEGERHFHKMPKKDMLLDLFFCCMGFTLLAIFIGSVRELLGKGTIAGTAISLPVSVSVVLLPSSGFILVGLLAAAAQSGRIHRQNKEKEKKRKKEK